MLIKSLTAWLTNANTGYAHSISNTRLSSWFTVFQLYVLKYLVLKRFVSQQLAI